MGICNSAKILAQSITESDLAVDPRQRLQLEILKLGPLYLEINNLPLWESAFQGTLLDDDVTKAGVLINDIYELAMLNMYGAFDQQRTRTLADEIIVNFRAADLNVEMNQLELDSW